MANWRKTKTPGVYVAHQQRCPAFRTEDGRCRCEPSWRGRRYNRVTGKSEWQKPVSKDRNEALLRRSSAPRSPSRPSRALRRRELPRRASVVLVSISSGVRAGGLSL